MICDLDRLCALLRQIVATWATDCLRGDISEAAAELGTPPTVLANILGTAHYQYDPAAIAKGHQGLWELLKELEAIFTEFKVRGLEKELVIVRNELDAHVRAKWGTVSVGLSPTKEQVDEAVASVTGKLIGQ